MANTHLSNHICDICGLKCSTKYGLIEHIRTHTGDRPFKCEMCGKGFAQRGTLGVHIRSIHKNERPYACEGCGKAFTTKGKLVKHKIVHMTNLEKKFVCEANGCDKAFSTKLAKHRHMKRHTAERKHKCTICDKAFTTGAALKRHIRCHTGEKPYECATCHKGFTQRYNLQNLSVIPNLNLCIDCTESLNIAYTFKCSKIEIVWMDGMTLREQSTSPSRSM
ncbi:putative GDNF-inducible zinc finger protein [Trypoxylus dichotomus]